MSEPGPDAAPDAAPDADARAAAAASGDRAARLRAALAVVGVELLLATAAGSLLMIVAGASPLAVWRAMFERTFTDRYAFGQVLFQATPLVFTGLAVAVPLRAGLFNIGGEGQMITGCLAAGAIGAALPAGTPWPLAIPACLAAAALAGGAVGAATGALRAYRGAHEVIVAILLNAIVAGVALWIGNAALFTHGTTTAPEIAPGAVLPALGLGGSAANLAIVVAALAAAAVWLVLARTPRGLTWRLVGQGPRAAAAAGVDVARTYVVTLAVGGALAGLAASSYVLGWRHAYQDELGAGAGFLGLAVALLGGEHPAGVAAAALFVGFLQNAQLLVSDLVPKELFDVLEAVIILVVAATRATVRRQRGRAA